MEFPKFFFPNESPKVKYRWKSDNIELALIYNRIDDCNDAKMAYAMDAKRYDDG